VAPVDLNFQQVEIDATPRRVPGLVPLEHRDEQ
jgi:hypothetical protein